MLMLGSAGRKAGKTEFACGVIGGLSGSHPVAAIKVTTVAEGESGCHRGGEGCGACGSLQGEYMISEENDPAAGKDTSRMLRAGASEVLWLRARREHLEKGMAEVLERIPAGTPIVCESNSARRVVEPGVFIVVKKGGEAEIKASCAAVIGEADRVLDYDGALWDSPIEDLSFARGRWLLRLDAAAIILAGGGSRRMGTDKGLLDFGGVPLISRIAEQLVPMFRQVMISANDPEKYGFLGLDVVPDLEPGAGPLMGIASALEHSRHELNLFTCCDMPAVDYALIRKMLIAAKDKDAVVPISPEGFQEPLFAVYRRSVAAVARAVLAEGGRRVSDIFGRLRLGTVLIPDTRRPMNLNTPEEYRKALMQEAVT